MKRTIIIESLSPQNFRLFGDVIEASGKADMMINQGRCARYHDLARLDFSDGKAGVSVFQAEIRTLPLQLDMMERHPFGSQSFIPMSLDPFLVIVAEDDGDKPATPRAFMTSAGQGVNFARNLWHGVLTPIQGAGLFAVIDRIGGSGENLEEYYFETPYEVRFP